VQTGEALAAATEEIITQRRFDHPCLLPLLAAATVVATPADGAAPRRDDAEDGVPTQHVLMLFPAYTARRRCAVQCLCAALTPRCAALVAQDGTLQDACDAGLLGGTRLPAVAVLRIILQVAEGLAAMHAHEPAFAHRDVKPANILLSVRCFDSTVVSVCSTRAEWSFGPCFACDSAGRAC
jgi:hypothetical protein